MNGTKHVWLKIELGFYGIIIKSCVVYIFKFVSFNFVVVVVVLFVLIVFFFCFSSCEPVVTDLYLKGTSTLTTE